MTFQLKTSDRLYELHGTIGLTDWDLDQELKLAKTTDQFHYDDKVKNEQHMLQRPSATASGEDEVEFYDETSGTFVKPSPWLLVNPNIVCPIPKGGNAGDQRRLCDHAEEIQIPEIQEPAETQRPPTKELHMLAPHDAPLQEKPLPSVSSSTDYLNEDASCRSTKTRRKGRTTKVRDSNILNTGCWPRPPVNYCILIALALKSSHTGSLKVQQIYNFTREHFPFFQTAPDGWKNTIRHNLCFNNSFRKTYNQLCRDGKRKSCFWHLTLDGQRRLKDDIRSLTGESLKKLERSMSCPGIIQSLLAL